MSSKPFNHTMDAEVEISCSIYPGYAEKGPSLSHAGGEPGCPPEIEDLCLTLNIGNIEIDLGAVLSKKQIEEIEQVIWQEVDDRDNYEGDI